MRQAYETLRTQRDRLAWELFDISLPHPQDVLDRAAPAGEPGRPTLAQFQQYVADGDISYYIAGGGMGGGRGGNSEIAQWVEANFTASTVGGVTVYDLRPVAS